MVDGSFLMEHVCMCTWLMPVQILSNASRMSYRTGKDGQVHVQSQVGHGGQNHADVGRWKYYQVL